MKESASVLPGTGALFCASNTNRTGDLTMIEKNDVRVVRYTDCTAPKCVQEMEDTYILKAQKQPVPEDSFSAELARVQRRDAFAVLNMTRRLNCKICALRESCSDRDRKRTNEPPCFDFEVDLDLFRKVLYSTFLSYPDK